MDSNDADYLYYETPFYEGALNELADLIRLKDFRFTEIYEEYWKTSESDPNSHAEFISNWGISVPDFERVSEFIPFTDCGRPSHTLISVRIAEIPECLYDKHES